MIEFISVYYFAHPCFKMLVTYRDVLLQSALRENTVEFRSQLSLRQNGKHHTLQHHGLRPLKTHNSKKLNSTTSEV